MKWRVVLEVTGPNGATVIHEASAGTWRASGASPATVGPSLADTGGCAALSCPNAGRLPLRRPPSMPALRRLPPDQGPPLAPFDDGVWRGGGRCSAFCRLAVRFDVAGNAQSAGRIHAGPLHTRIRTHACSDGCPPAVWACRDADERIPAAQRWSCH